MRKIPLVEIPRDRALTLEVSAEREELNALFEDVEDFAPAEDADFSARVRLQRVRDAVRVAGDVEMRVRLSCGRCLEERDLYVDAELEYMLVSRETWLESSQSSVVSGKAEGDDEAGKSLTPEDLDMHYFDGDEVEILPLLREAIVLELPPYGVCPPSMRAECDQAYEANLGEEGRAMREQSAVDPRWAKLLEIKAQKKKKTD